MEIINQPSLTFIIPTLNSEKDIKECLEGIAIQDYPKNKIKIFIMDGGSKDKTKEIAKEFNCYIIENPKVIAEYGKAIGIKKSKSDYFILLDSDNIIEDSLWLKKMIHPILIEKDIIGVESQFGTKKEMSFLNRYAALMRIADPIARMFVSKPEIIKKDNYIILKHKTGERIVSGANGFLWNKELVNKFWDKGEVFEEANFTTYLCEEGFCSYAVPNDTYVYHEYVKNLRDFIKKRRKIAGKFLNRKTKKINTWLDNLSLSKKILVTLYCLSIILPLLEAIKNSIRDKDTAWFIHPVTCFITAVLYTYSYVKWGVRG